MDGDKINELIRPVLGVGLSGQCVDCMLGWNHHCSAINSPHKNGNSIRLYRGGFQRDGDKNSILIDFASERSLYHFRVASYFHGGQRTVFARTVQQNQRQIASESMSPYEPANSNKIIGTTRGVFILQSELKSCLHGRRQSDEDNCNCMPRVE